MKTRRSVIRKIRITYLSIILVAIFFACNAQTSQRWYNEPYEQHLVNEWVGGTLVIIGCTEMLVGVMTAQPICPDLKLNKTEFLVMTGAPIMITGALIQLFHPIKLKKYEKISFYFNGNGVYFACSL